MSPDDLVGEIKEYKRRKAEVEALITKQQQKLRELEKQKTHYSSVIFQLIRELEQAHRAEGYNATD